MNDSLVPLVASLALAMSELGDLLLEKREAQDIDGEWHGSQLKSSADLFAHDFLVSTLGKLTPEIPVISEESINLNDLVRPSYYWLIDPIDGTASYVNGFDGFVTQAALIRDSIPQLGVIYAPVTKECYTAVMGRGAYKNGMPIQNSNNADEIRIIDNYPEPRGITKSLMEKFTSSEYIESGSLSLKALRVIEGAADIFVKDVVVRDWDFAAPMAISNELSGIIRQVDDQPFELTGNWEKNGVIVCRDQDLYRQVCRILN